MKKKVLFVATVVKKHIMVFHIPYLKWFKENGYETYVCARNDYENPEECVIPYCDYYYDIPFERSPFKLNNFRAYKRLKNIIDFNEFDLIHCHTPVGGALTRLAARSARQHKSTSVIYTVHGFHFFKGAPLKDWLIFYSIEKYLSRWTDALITMNGEDFGNGKKITLRTSTEVYHVNGIGINKEKFIPQTEKAKKYLRKEYGFKESDFILIYVGELSHRKNQSLLIETMSILKGRIPNIKLLLVGSGSLEKKYKKQVDNLKVSEIVNFLGYRTDIVELMTLSDLAVSSSIQEGLPVNVMEAMATGLPLVVTNSRGNRDLVVNGVNGFVGDNDVNKFSNAIAELLISDEQRIKLGNSSLDLIDKYSLDNVMEEMKRIYLKHMTVEKNT
ncbi:glycosyltransferase family 4 protein [Virgibacillus siamensis]|uniref:Glycosyltransferase family 4 protein n=1 Tax=Virgibacillus siamensis TaxID=480071 RepID=A0ABN1G8N2_9BACI